MYEFTIFFGDWPYDVEGNLHALAGDGVKQSKGGATCRGLTSPFGARQRILFGKKVIMQIWK